MRGRLGIGTERVLDRSASPACSPFYPGFLRPIPRLPAQLAEHAASVDGSSSRDPPELRAGRSARARARRRRRRGRRRRRAARARTARTARTKPPTAGPDRAARAPTTASAPRSSGRAGGRGRCSATSAWCAGPWKHSPIPNSASATRDDDERRGRRRASSPRASTISHATPRAPASARARASGAAPRSQRDDRQLRDHDHDRVDEEDDPIWRSLTSAWSRANGGTRLNSE